MAGGDTANIYAAAAYFTQQSTGGAGYPDYEPERAYREQKGGRIIDWMLSGFAGEPTPHTLVEVGSGFGFTRKAATDRGLLTVGVDVSPHAGRAAKRLYGMETFVGTLASALQASAVVPGGADGVLYQFVLEHVSDPEVEIQQAARALSPGGVIGIIVPSMEAVELSVFGASYRSLRSDHLHLFSRDSLTRILSRAGLDPISLQSECNVHLLAAFLSPAELHHIYESGRGPDLLVLARKRVS